MRRVLILWLAAALMIAIPLPALTVSASSNASGPCGETSVWTFSEDVLTLSGTGSIDSEYPAPWHAYKDQITKVVIESGIAEIGDCVFIDHKNLMEVQLPETLTHIGGQVFQGCDKLKEIYIPQNVETIGHPGTYRTPATTFSCSAMTNILVAPENEYFHSIDGVLFDSISNALLCYPQGKPGDSYTVPYGIKEIGGGAFWFSDLQNIELPDSVQIIGENAFSSTRLVSISIPPAVSAIPRSTFSHCKQLARITIPERVQSIGRDAFAACDALEDIIFLSSDCIISNVTSTIPRKTAIHGQMNSSVQTYALTYGYRFVDSQTQTIYHYDAGNEGLINLLPINLHASCPAFNRVTSGGDQIGGYQPTLVLETNLENETYQEMLAFVQSLTIDCSSDREKAYRISCWVNDNMNYEYACFGVGETAEGMYKLWEERRSNCEGYTQLTNFLLYLAGIPNATATSLGHCWTVALLDGAWCMIDSTNRFFDRAPNECDDIKNIFFSVNNTLACVIDDFTGVKLSSYGLNVRDNDTYQEIVIPNYITSIYGSTFIYREYGPGDPYVTIRGDVGSYVQTYIEKNLPNYLISYEGDQFVATMKKEDDIPAHTHILQQVNANPASHEVAGNAEHYRCTDCGAIFWDADALNACLKEQIVIPPVGHEFKDYGCDTLQHWRVCACGQTKDAEGHSWNGWVVVVSATATNTGVEHRCCTICGYKEARELQFDPQQTEGQESSESSVTTQGEQGPPTLEMTMPCTEFTRSGCEAHQDITPREDNIAKWIALGFGCVGICSALIIGLWKRKREL